MSENNLDIKHLPHDGFFYLNMAEKSFQKFKGNFTESQAQKTIQYNNYSIALLGNYDFFVAKAYRRIGEIYEEMGDSKKAIENYKLALKHNPKVGIKNKLKILDPNNELYKSRVSSQ